MTLALILTAAFSIIAAGTFAWFSLIQSTTNDFAYSPDDLKLIKCEAGTEKPLPGAVFDLYDSSNQRIGRYVTDEQGEISVTGLDADKSYYFKEIKPPYGYRLPDDPYTPLTAPGGDAIRFENVPIRAGLSITKKISPFGFDGEPYAPTGEDRLFPFAFTVYLGTEGAPAGPFPYEIHGRDGGPIQAYSYTYAEGPDRDKTITVQPGGSISSGGVLYLRDGETAVIQDVPSLTPYRVSEQNYITYDRDPAAEAVRLGDRFGCTDGGEAPRHDAELAVMSGWGGFGDNTAGVVPEDGVTVTFENRRVPENYKATMSSLVVVDRILAHPDDIDPKKGFEVTITVGEDPDQTYYYEIVHPRHLTGDGTDLPYYHRNDPGLPDNRQETTAVTNTTTPDAFVQPGQPASPAPKAPLHFPSDYERWKLEDEASSGGQTRFARTARAGGAGQELLRSGGNTIVVNLHHGSAIIIYGIPTGTRYCAGQVDYTHIDGYMIDSTYKTEGHIQPDLEAIPDNDPKTSDRRLLRTRADIYNYFVRPVMRTIHIEKRWEHGDDPGPRPESAAIDILDAGSSILFDSRDLTAMEDWKAEVEVPKYDPETGKEIIYQVQEHLSQGAADYILGDVRVEKDGLDLSYTLTNVYAPATVRPLVEKVVEHEGQPPEKEGSFTFEIARLTAGAPMPAEGNTVSIRGEGIAFFGDIQFTQPGVYSYRIWEHGGRLAGWRYDFSQYILTVTVEEGADGTLTAVPTYSKNGERFAAPLFTNRFTSGLPPESGSLTIVKQVTGENADRTKKFDFTVRLEDIAYHIRLAHGESYTITGIPVGARYTVTEERTPGYTVSSSGETGVIKKEGSTVCFLNSADSAPTGPDGKNSGILVIRKTVTGPFLDAAKQFRFLVTIGDAEYEVLLRHGESETFRDLPVGIPYRVEEEDCSAEQYSTVSRNAAGKIGDGTVTAEFINRYEGEEPPSPGDGSVLVSGQKTWMHGYAPQEARPRSITVCVLSGSTIVVQKEVTEEDGWRYIFRLPKYDQTGKEIVYSVSEAPVEGYSPQIDGYSILNTYRTSDPGDEPKTGDGGVMWLWFLVLMLSSACLWRVAFYWKTDKKRSP